MFLFSNFLNAGKIPNTGCTVNNGWYVLDSQPNLIAKHWSVTLVYLRISFVTPRYYILLVYRDITHFYILVLVSLQVWKEYRQLAIVEHILVYLVGK